MRTPRISSKADVKKTAATAKSFWTALDSSPPLATPFAKVFDVIGIANEGQRAIPLRPEELRAAQRSGNIGGAAPNRRHSFFAAQILFRGQAL